MKLASPAALCPSATAQASAAVTAPVASALAGKPLPPTGKLWPAGKAFPSSCNRRSNARDESAIRRGLAGPEAARR